MENKQFIKQISNQKTHTHKSNKKNKTHCVPFPYSQMQSNAAHSNPQSGVVRFEKVIESKAIYPNS